MEYKLGSRLNCVLENCVSFRFFVEENANFIRFCLKKNANSKRIRFCLKKKLNVPNGRQNSKKLQFNIIKTQIQKHFFLFGALLLLIIIGYVPIQGTQKSPSFHIKQLGLFRSFRIIC